MTDTDEPAEAEAAKAEAPEPEPAQAEAAEAEAPEPEAPEPEAAEADPHALDDAHAQLLARFEAELGDAVLEQAANFGTPVVRIRRDSWRRAAEVARLQLDCDYLSFIAGIDWAPAPKEGDDAGGDTSSPVQPSEVTYGVAGSEGRFQVLAHVQSTRHHTGITMKVDIDDASADGEGGGMLAESWVPVYPGADWHERECWEMFGITFEGHPAIRHLYLPDQFEGHPLRKDFPLLSRTVKPWPGLVDVEAMPDDLAGDDAAGEAADAGTTAPDTSSESSTDAQPAGDAGGEQAP
ncbi:MAG: NADH-quinone oxidoreductase subunit C [Acidimicrobiia bacterium]